MTYCGSAGQLAWEVHGLPAGTNPCAPGYAPPAGRSVSYTRDARGRLLGADYADAATADKSWTWELNGLPKTATRHAAGSAPASTWTWTHYRRGLLKTETLAIDSRSFTFTHDYTPGGQPASLRYPSSRLVDFSPDALGRPSQLGSWLTDLEWAPGGQLAGADYGGGITASWTYNTRELPAQTDYTRLGTALSTRSLSWDAIGNLASIADAAPRAASAVDCGALDAIFCSSFEAAASTAGTGSWQFTYDRFDRLERVTNPYGIDDAFTYDPLGNLRSASELGRWDIDPVTNRISQRVNGGSVFTHLWDTQGKLASDGERSFTWNDAGELTAASDQTSRYAYDAAGWRVRVQQGSAAPIYYLYDQAHRLLARWDAATQTETDFLHAGGKMLVRIEGNAPTYVLPDWQGSPLFETDASGTITRQPVYLGYGRTNGGGPQRDPRLHRRRHGRGHRPDLPRRPLPLPQALHQPRSRPAEPRKPQRPEPLCLRQQQSGAVYGPGWASSLGREANP